MRRFLSKILLRGNRLSSKLPTIIDNRSENTLLATLSRLLNHAHRLGVATGTFEVSSLLALEGRWQLAEAIRLVMGDETTRRTKEELIKVLQRDSDRSIEEEKARDDRLTGLDAIREHLRDNRLAVRVYAKAKFHAKCYLVDSLETSLVDFAVVGSSNFTRSGLSQNLELNLLTTDQIHIERLRQWYEDIWGESELVNDVLLKVIEPHLAEYTPFTAYARSLHAFFAGREKLQDDWEANESVIYKMLSKYQKDGYHQALGIAEK